MTTPQPPVQPLNIIIPKPYHLTLTRNAKGLYQWEISIHVDNAVEALDTAQFIDFRLKETYPHQ